MPTFAIVWLTLVLLAIFFAASTVLLRVGCDMANGLVRQSHRYTLIQVPNYRMCFAIAFRAVIILSLASVLETRIIAVLVQCYANEWLWKVLVSLVEWIAFAALVASGLSATQPAPTRLVVLASLLHVCLLLSLVICLPRLMAAIFV